MYAAMNVQSSTPLLGCLNPKCKTMAAMVKGHKTLVYLLAVHEDLQQIWRNFKGWKPLRPLSPSASMCLVVFGCGPGWASMSRCSLDGGSSSEMGDVVDSLRLNTLTFCERHDERLRWLSVGGGLARVVMLAVEVVGCRQ